MNSKVRTGNSFKDPPKREKNDIIDKLEEDRKKGAVEKERRGRDVIKRRS